MHESTSVHVRQLPDVQCSVIDELLTVQLPYTSHYWVIGDARGYAM